MSPGTTSPATSSEQTQPTRTDTLRGSCEQGGRLPACLPAILPRRAVTAAMVCSSAGGSAGGVFGGAARPGRQAGSFLLINRASQHPCESPHPPSHTLTLPAYSLPCLPCLPCPACLPPLPAVQAPHHQVGHAGPAAACARLLPSSHPQPLQATPAAAADSPADAVWLLAVLCGNRFWGWARFPPCHPAHLLAATSLKPRAFAFQSI